MLKLANTFTYHAIQDMLWFILTQRIIIFYACICPEENWQLLFSIAFFPSYLHSPVLLLSYPLPSSFFLLFCNFIYIVQFNNFFLKKEISRGRGNCHRVSHIVKGWHAWFFVVSKCKQSLMVFSYSTIQFKLLSQEGS